MDRAKINRAKVSFAKRYNLFFYFRYLVLIIWAVIVILPIYWMLITSLKDSGEWVSWPPNWIPENPTIVNYATIFTVTGSGIDESRERDGTAQTFNIWKALRDSVLISTLGSLIAVLLGSFLAYSISRFAVGGKNFRYLILTIRMVPPIVIAIPIMMYYAILIPSVSQLILGTRISLYDTYLGLGMLYVATTLPFVIWMMLSFIDEIPYTFEHAARIMGAGRMYTLVKVVLPLVAPGLVVTFLFIFILNWSEFLLALTLTQQDVNTLPVLLNKFQSAVEGRLYGPQAAIGVVITVPVIIMGMLIQKHLVKGFTFGMIRK
ncbi:MAG: carbohydrate ABC transporter permease [Deltaproteobacteria bacterium]|nr:carbohydrate ABC transporter permease [Deltaproteobacteria bacterium]